MFGSAIKDMADEYSNIDIAIVSKDFSGMLYYDVKKVNNYRSADSPQAISHRGL